MIAEWIQGLSDGARKGLFALVAVLLVAGVGWFMLSGNGDTPEPTDPAVTDTAAPVEPVNPGSTEPMPAPTGTGIPYPTGGQVNPLPTGPVDPDNPDATTQVEPPDVSEVKMPVTEQELLDAFTVAERFASAYQTYGYDTSPESWVEAIDPYAASNLYGLTPGGYPTGAAYDRMVETKSRSVSSGRVNEVFLIGRDSIAVIVATNVVITAEGEEPVKTNSTWRVTLIKTGGAWKVNNVQQDGQGDMGEG